MQYGDELSDALQSVLRSGWYLQGSRTAAFEEEYSRYIGTGHCVGVANGLDALTLIFRAYMEMGRLSAGDEVLVPANTYIASILSVSENGLRPVLVEPSLDTLEMDDGLLEQAVTPRTKAVMIVHLYGRCAYTRRIADVCHRNGLLLIEDNAQAHGCMFEGRRTGSLGDAAGHSFYPGKNLGALGDGGAVTTDDADLATCIRQLANYGSERKYVFKYRGRNSRLDELQAAVLSVKLRHLDDDNRRRQAIASYYYNNICSDNVDMPLHLPDEQNVYHIFPVLCRRRDELQRHLYEHGVQTLLHYPIPPHQQECYSGYWPGLSLPLTERIHLTELSLPVSPVMSADDARYVADSVNSFR
jgi:dTDP-4-amino-4,6-dideoxygalactose transaminase